MGNGAEEVVGHELQVDSGGKVYTVTQGVLGQGGYSDSEGKIAAVGRDLPLEPGCEKIDASGLSVYPGMIDTHTHLGLDEWGNWDEINELNEMGDPITPQLRAVDGFHWQDRALAESARAGVTSIIVHTGSIQLFSGQSMAVKTRPGTLQKTLLDGCIGIKGGFGGTPKAFYGALGGYPATRMGEAYVLRQALADACAYRDHRILPRAGNGTRKRRCGRCCRWYAGKFPGASMCISCTIS